MNKTFDETVRAMTAAEIIMAMVNGLRKRHVKIFMHSFGGYNKETKVCHGCAATNAICEIAGETFTPDVISLRDNRADFLNTDSRFLCKFEEAIDHLRGGCIHTYNDYARRGGFAQIKPQDGAKLPALESAADLCKLPAYEQLAEYNAQIN